MITKGRVHRNFKSLESVFDHLSHQVCVSSYFFTCVAPDVVGRVIPSPEKHIWLLSLDDVLHHTLKSIHWYVAKSTSKLTSL